MAFITGILGFFSGKFLYSIILERKHNDKFFFKNIIKEYNCLIINKDVRLIQICSAFIFLYAYLVSFNILNYIFLLSFLLVLLIIAYMDFTNPQEGIDDRLIVLGLIISFFISIFNYSLHQFFFGILLAILLGLSIYLFSYFRYGPNNFGSGDITLSILIGSYVGPHDLLLTYAIMCILALIFLFLKHSKYIALAPYFVIATFIIDIINKTNLGALII